MVNAIEDIGQDFIVIVSRAISPFDKLLWGFGTVRWIGMDAAETVERGVFTVTIGYLVNINLVYLT